MMTEDYEKTGTGLILRFRSMGGKIRSSNQYAVRPNVTPSAARRMLNELYTELAKHDPEKAEAICRQQNA